MEDILFGGFGRLGKLGWFGGFEMLVLIQLK